MEETPNKETPDKESFADKEKLSIIESAAIVAKCIAEIVEMSTNEEFRDFMKNTVNSVGGDDDLNSSGDFFLYGSSFDSYETKLRRLIEESFAVKYNKTTD